MPAKKSNVFNSEFDFDFENNDQNAKPKNENKTSTLIKLKKQMHKEQKAQDKKNKVKNDSTDFDNSDNESAAAGSDNEQINAVDESIQKKQDHVRIKAQSAKVIASNQNDFFEMPSKEETDLSSFEEMNISKPLTKALNQMGLTIPTKIQSAAIPTALMGKDICACAVTGSGKTLAFMLPALERLLYKPKFPQVTRVLVLTPTRELAVQICKVTRELSQFTNINTCLCAGGFDIKTQEASLRLGPDICIATPGRLIDHLHNTPCFNLETVEILILDEADRMLDECFAEQLKEVMRLCSKTHQTMLFSATMTDTVEDLVKMSLKRPVKIFLNQNVDVTPLLKQEFVRLRDSTDRNREVILAALVQRKFNDRCIVFVRTKSDCHRISLLLELLDIKAAELHGGLSQIQRLEKLTAFKENTLHVLVATDLASRGLDIENVKTVINFSMPLTFKHYIHRVGRTARAQNSGRSISLVAESDRWLVKEIVKSSKEPVKCRVIPPDVIQFYREKLNEVRIELGEKLQGERNEKLMEKMDKDLSRAQNSMERTGNKNKKPSDMMGARPKRTWLKDVDYKNGGLISENKAKSKKVNNKRKRSGDDDASGANHADSDNDDSSSKTAKSSTYGNTNNKRFKKQNGLNDNIFSKNFRQNPNKKFQKRNK